MTKLKDALPTSFLGFRFWLDDRICETVAQFPPWLPTEDFQDFPFAVRSEHGPYHAIRHAALMHVSKWGLEKALSDAGFTAAQICSDEMSRFIESALPREIALWTLTPAYSPRERLRRAWCAAAIYFAFGNGNRHKAARVCNSGLVREDQNSGVAEEAIRDALYGVARRAKIMGWRLSHQIQVEICEALATWKVWQDLAEGVKNMPGRRRLKTAEAWRRSGDLYVRFHRHFDAATIDEGQILSHAIELGKLKLKLLGEPYVGARLASEKGA